MTMKRNPPTLKPQKIPPKSMIMINKFKPTVKADRKTVVFAIKRSCIEAVEEAEIDKFIPTAKIHFNNKARYPSVYVYDHASTIADCLNDPEEGVLGEKF